MDSADLTGNKQRRIVLNPRHLGTCLRLLPQRERNLIRLVYYRGASHGELAGLLGISRSTLRWLLSRAIERATDPRHVAILKCWGSLQRTERRLAYLHCVAGLTLPEIVRQRLLTVQTHAGPPRPAGMVHLRNLVRSIERKARRRMQRREGVRSLKP